MKTSTKAAFMIPLFMQLSGLAHAQIFPNEGYRDYSVKPPAKVEPPKQSHADIEKELYEQQAAERAKSKGTDASATADKTAEALKDDKTPQVAPPQVGAPTKGFVKKGSGDVVSGSPVRRSAGDGKASVKAVVPAPEAAVVGDNGKPGMMAKAGSFIKDHKAAVIGGLGLGIIGFMVGGPIGALLGVALGAAGGEFAPRLFGR